MQPAQILLPSNLEQNSSYTVSFGAVRFSNAIADVLEGFLATGTIVWLLRVNIGVECSLLAEITKFGTDDLY